MLVLTALAPTSFATTDQPDSAVRGIARSIRYQPLFSSAEL